MSSAVCTAEIVTPSSPDAGACLTSPAGAAAVANSLPFTDFCRDDSLERGWAVLAAQASLPTQSPSFSRALAKSSEAGTETELFFVRDADGVAALLPLSRPGRTFARWTTAGARDISEPEDALAVNAEAARLLAEAVVRSSRPLDLERIPARSPLIAALRAAIRGKGLVWVRPATPTPTITLDESWADPQRRFNSGRRSDFRRAERIAGGFGEVSFEILSPAADEFDRLFDEAVGVEAKSWKTEAGTALAADRRIERFFRDYFRTASAEGTFRIAFMRIDGRAVAMQMGIETLNRYWLFKIGFDEGFARCSPGTLLMLHTLGWAAKRRLGAYEFLGNLDPWITQFWTREQHEHVRLRTYPFNARGAVALAADALAWIRSTVMRRSN